MDRNLIRMMKPQARLARLELIVSQWWYRALISYKNYLHMIERVDRIRIEKGILQDNE